MLGEMGLKTRVGGVKQHYRVSTGEPEIRTVSDRFEFYGNGRELGMAVALTDHWVPKKRFQIAEVRDFVSNHKAYANYGY